MTLKLTLTAAVICGFALFSTAQNEQNILPNTGKIGIGTVTPTTKLEINGNVKVDSCLIVKDTAFFENDVKLEEKLVVSGSAIIKVNIFPNPVTASGEITVNIHNEELSTVSIFDANGTLMMTENVRLGSNTIDLKVFNSGTYYLLFQNESATFHITKKIVKL